MSDSDALNEVAGLKEEVARLRGGEEDGYHESRIPTPGQLLKRIHDLDPQERIERLDALIATAEAAHHCHLNMHEANLQELRQRVMNTWSALAAISSLCRAPDRDGLIHVSEITELLPEALRYG